MGFTLIIFIAVLALLVLVHELGHFWMARKMGVKAEEFGLGFPPRIWGSYRDKDGKRKRVWGNKKIKDVPGTVYSINWLPLGGFVKIKGENGDDKDKDSFASKPIWRRALILAAGVLMNIALAVVLISVGYMIGFPDSTINLPAGAEVTEKRVQIVQVVNNSPAKEAGLKVGDIVLSMSGEVIDTEIELQQVVAAHPEEIIPITVRRQNNVIEIMAEPELNEAGNGSLGVAILSTGLVKYPWYQAIWEGLKVSMLLLWAIIVAFFELIRNLIISQPIDAEIAGPVGIADLTGQFARMGFTYLLQFTALLSLNLAVLNILPFPALDGGRLVFLAIEKIKGSPVKQDIELAIHNLGFIALMMLVLVVTFKDIARFFS